MQIQYKLGHPSAACRPQPPPVKRGAWRAGCRALRAQLCTELEVSLAAREEGLQLHGQQRGMPGYRVLRDLPCTALWGVTCHECRAS